MATFYDLFATPDTSLKSGEDKTTKLHPRVVSRGTITSDEMFDIIADKGSLTKGDLVGASQAIADEIHKNLANGYDVHLKGIGFFSLGLTSEIQGEGKRISSSSISVDKIKFRAEAKFKERFKTIELKKSPKQKETKEFTNDLLIKRICIEMETSNMLSFSIATLIKLTGLTYKKAKLKLIELQYENKITKHTNGRFIGYTIVK